MQHVDWSTLLGWTCPTHLHDRCLFTYIFLANRLSTYLLVVSWPIFYRTNKRAERQTTWRRKRDAATENEKIRSREKLENVTDRYEQLNCVIVVRRIEPWSCYYVYFRTNALGKGMKLLTPPVMGEIVSLLFFYKGVLDIRLPIKVDMPLKQRNWKIWTEMDRYTHIYAQREREKERGGNFFGFSV